jgi:dCMP deaminase
MMENKWNNRFMDMAKAVSLWSKDPSTKVGAVAVGSKKQILATGFNGFPRGISDTIERLENREIKYDYIVHAEKNLIYNASYTGTSLDGAAIYVYGLPVCLECAKGIIQVGISEIYVSKECLMSKPNWYDSWLKSKAMFEEVGLFVDLV